MGFAAESEKENLSAGHMIDELNFVPTKNEKKMNTKSYSSEGDSKSSCDCLVDDAHSDRQPFLLCQNLTKRAPNFANSAFL